MVPAHDPELLFAPGWESWDITSRPLIPERIPVLVDDDLLQSISAFARAFSGLAPALPDTPLSIGMRLSVNT